MGQESPFNTYIFLRGCCWAECPQRSGRDLRTVGGVVDNQQRDCVWCFYCCCEGPFCEYWNRDDQEMVFNG